MMLGIKGNATVLVIIHTHADNMWTFGQLRLMTVYKHVGGIMLYLWDKNDKNVIYI